MEALQAALAERSCPSRFLGPREPSATVTAVRRVGLDRGVLVQALRLGRAR